MLAEISKGGGADLLGGESSCPVAVERMSMHHLAAAVFTPHARNRMMRRGIAEAAVRNVLETPESVTPVRPGRLIAQKALIMGEPEREYLIRVVVDVDRSPPEIVTTYRTSRVAKYRRA